MEDFFLRVFRATSEIDYCDSIWWRTDGEYAPVSIFVNCSDLFYWACADVERLTPENIAHFEEACKDAEKAGEGSRGPELFCARVRKMRPQPPCYKGTTDCEESEHDMTIKERFAELHVYRDVGVDGDDLPDRLDRDDVLELAERIDRERCGWAQAVRVLKSTCVPGGHRVQYEEEHIRCLRHAGHLGDCFGETACGRGSLTWKNEAHAENQASTPPPAVEPPRPPERG